MKDLTPKARAPLATRQVPLHDRFSAGGSGQDRLPQLSNNRGQTTVRGLRVVFFCMLLDDNNAF
jgi:hypothetical protein